MTIVQYSDKSPLESIAGDRTRRAEGEANALLTVDESGRFNCFESKVVQVGFSVSFHGA